jgi:hypothetical protein
MQDRFVTHPTEYDPTLDTIEPTITPLSEPAMDALLDDYDYTAFDNVCNV